MIAQISKIKPKSTIIGARVVLRKLKSSSSLKTLGSSEPPPEEANHNDNKADAEKDVILFSQWESGLFLV
jgi:hypothetical protein